MMPTDQWGCPVTGDASDVELLERATVDYVTMSPGLAAHLGPLAEAGPLAGAVLAQLLTQSHRPHLVAQARHLSEQVRAGASGLTDRERHHIEAAWAWSRGDLATTLSVFDQLLADHPTDLLALWSRYLLQFSAGRVGPMLDGIRAAALAWTDDLPLASRLDGMEAFALEEAGQYRDAEPLGRRGVARDPTDLWAIHAVAHVLEMEQRRPEGVGWISETMGSLPPPAPGPAGFAGHLWWHQTLALVALGRHHDALAVLDERVYPGRSDEGLDLSNTISLLARLEAVGVNVGQRWEALVEPASARLGQHSHPFNDTHNVLALSRAGRTDLSARMLEEMRAWSRRDADHGAEVLRVVGLPVAEAFHAYGQGATATTVERLEPVVGELWRLGGSHAQRELYLIVLASARNGGPGHIER